MLTLETLTPYLMSRGFVAPADVVDAPNDLYTVLNYSSRNRAFKVLAPGKPGLLVKQGMDPDAAEYRDTLVQEARFLQAVGSEPALRPLASFIPGLRYYDPRHAIVVGELVQPATSLTKYHLNLGEFTFPREAADTAGHLLGTFHDLGARAVAAGKLGFIRHRPPSVWSLPGRLQQQAREGDGPAARLHHLIQEKGSFWSSAPRLELAWGQAREVVHRDPRWDNFLLTHGRGAAGRMNMRMIDWELVGLGDSAWDVAFFLCEYVRFWTFFAPSDTSVTTLDSVIERQRFAFRDWHPAAAAFWSAYCRARGFDRAEAADLRRRVVSYLPFNLALVANESLPVAAARPWTIEVAMELAERSAKDPKTFVADVLGLEV